MDLVPPGGIASGMELETMDDEDQWGWRFVMPDLERLWQEYKAGNG